MLWSGHFQLSIAAGLPCSPLAESVQGCLQQRRGGPEIRRPEAVDGGGQFNQSTGCSLGENTQDPSDPQAPGGGNASRCLFVEQDDVCFYRLGQEDRRLFASLKFLQTRGCQERKLFDADPGR